jgi:hypothetical protein
MHFLSTRWKQTTAKGFIKVFVISLYSYMLLVRKLSPIELAVKASSEIKLHIKYFNSVEADSYAGRRPASAACAPRAAVRDFNPAVVCKRPSTARVPRR